MMFGAIALGVLVGMIVAAVALVEITFWEWSWFNPWNKERTRKKAKQLTPGQEAQKWAEFFKEMRSDDMTNEQYHEIYGDDEDAIREAKESWARAGEQVIESTRKFMRHEVDV